MYFIDVQGTLIDDEAYLPIRGSKEFINYLNNNHTDYMVVTNNTKQTTSAFLNYLNNIGLNITQRNYLDPLMLLEEVVDKKSVAAYGTSNFLTVLTDMGYELNFKNPKTVLVSIKDDFIFNEFEQMIKFILNGAKLVGMHGTTLYAKNNKRYPGVGAILKMLSFATSTSYEIVGKPSKLFYYNALKKLNNNLSFKDIIMISDDLKGDLVEIAKLGAKTIFVLSGKYKNANEIIPFISKNEQPDFIFKDIKEMMEKI